MSITDELREYVGLGDGTVPREIRAIADRIDAEHEEALREAYAKGCEEGMGMANAKDAQAEYLRGRNDGYDEGWDAGFASADDWLAQNENAMREHARIHLPLMDADDVPIHIGDVMDFTKNVRDLTVLGIGIVDAHERSYGVFVREDNDYVWYNAEFLHHHIPTVEDVLHEFICDHEEGIRDEVDLITEYATKLRLAGDGKEG